MKPKGENQMIMFRKSTFICGLAAALLGVAMLSSAADAPSPVQAVHAADDAWLKAYNSGDLETVVSLYDEHAEIYPPGRPAVHGKAESRELSSEAINNLMNGSLKRQRGGISRSHASPR